MKTGNSCYLDNRRTSAALFERADELLKNRSDHNLADVAHLMRIAAIQLERTTQHLESWVERWLVAAIAHSDPDPLCGSQTDYTYCPHCGKRLKEGGQDYDREGH